jgi:hypothetical protein
MTLMTCGSFRIGAGARCIVASLALALLSFTPSLAAAQQADTEAEIASDYDWDVDTDASALTDFRAELDPYGTWTDDARYGTVWIPSSVVVGSDFAPYRTGGHWAVADDGQWLWVSDYSWGHIPFHYGRWVWIASTGWAWIPGRVYAPAWVIWRTGEPGYDYLGWAPMPPSYVWLNGVATGFAWGITVPWWFCPSVYFFTPTWQTHIVHDHVLVSRIVHHTHLYHYDKMKVGLKPPAGHAPGSHIPAKATVNTAKSATIGGMARSPSFVEARVPKNAVPIERVSHDVRATKLRLPSGNASRASGSSSRADAAAPAARVTPPPVEAARVPRVDPAPRVEAARMPHVNPAPRIEANTPAGHPHPGPVERAPQIPRVPRAETPRAYEPAERPSAFASRASRFDSPRSSSSFDRPSSSSFIPHRSYHTPGQSDSWSTEPSYRSPSFSTSRSWSAPSRSYSAPSRSYSAPSQNYSAPSRSWSAPSRSYSAPSRSISVPSRSYSAPSHSFSAPSRSYSAPSHSFSAPSRSYSAPSRSFSAPSRSLSVGRRR